jgi:hypothetical protein
LPSVKIDGLISKPGRLENMVNIIQKIIWTIIA